MLFGSNGTSYTVSLISQLSVYMHTFFINIETRVEQEKNLGQQWMSRAKETLPRVILGTRALGFASPDLQDART